MPGNGLTEYVLHTAKSLLCDEAMFEELTQSGEVELVGAQSPIWLGVPLIVAGKAIGVMVVQDYKNAAAYSEREQRILEFVSSQTAMAIQRKQAEEELRTSEERYRLLMETLPDGVIVHSQGRIIFANTASAKISAAANPAELIGKPVMEFVQPEYRELALKRIQRSLSEGVPAPAEEEKFIRLDGTQIDVQVTALPFSYAGIPAMLTVISDITERKQAELELKKEKEKAQNYLEIAEVMIVAIDSTQNVILVNRKACEVLDYTEEEILGSNWFELALPEKNRDIVKEVFADIIAGKITSREYFENIILNRRGEERLIAWHNTILKDMDDNITGTLSSGEDITERKRAEEALLQSEAALKQAQQVAQVGSWIWHVQSNQLEWSDEMYHIFGIEKENFSGDLSEVINRAIHPEDRTIVERSNLSVVKDNKPIPVEYRVIWPDGTVHLVWAEAGKLILDDEGKSVTLTGIVQDITERKRAEEALARSNDQLRALTAYWQAAIEAERANISREIHDEFGQSMTALKMDLTWLTNRLPEGDEKIGRIHGMNALVDDSIALMRRIATELRPNLLDDLGLNAALEWQAREFSRRNGIPCKVNLPQHDLGLDLALKTSLFRIFQETLTNVTRHAQATRVNVSLQLKDKSVILTTQDNGIGISKGELEEPRSLGLLSLRERAAQWGGETTILGEPGKGTTVTTRIPLPASTVDGGKR
jgi:PAS domain S-box-containing protein